MFFRVLTAIRENVRLMLLIILERNRSVIMTEAKDHCLHWRPETQCGSCQPNDTKNNGSWE